jgi:hypothetical protein
MSIINEIKRFFKENTRLIFLIGFILFITYGYFITNWSISIDNELHAFTGYDRSHHFDLVKRWIQQGRFLIALLNFLGNYQIIPYFNDSLSILFLLASSIIWLLTLSKVKELDNSAKLIFALVYLVSPIYVFYLRFTTYNVDISIGLLFISLSIYYFTVFLESNLQNKLVYLISFVYLLCAISIYQVFVVYYITALLFLILYKSTTEIRKCDFYAKPMLNQLGLGLLMLCLTMLTYLIISKIIYLFIPASSYTDNFIQWGTHDFSTIYNGLVFYFKTVLLIQRFNYLILITGICSAIFLFILIIKRLLSLSMILLFVGFLISPFIMVFAFGFSMPLRTMQAIPLMLGGMWLLIYTIIEARLLQRIVLIIIVICTYFNAQYVTRLFYGDSMRLQYDIKFANQIYNFVNSVIGDSIATKPLAIVGMHSNTDNPFILRSIYDTVGYSFFEWDNGNYKRKHKFMQWLGNYYTLPSDDQQKLAEQLSFSMPNYPAKGSISATESMVILKLSQPFIKPDQQPLGIKFNNFEKLSSMALNAYLDNISIENHVINYWGWSYIRNANAKDTIIFLKLSSNDGEYIFPCNRSTREDIGRAYSDGLNLQNSGFFGTLKDNVVPKGTYQVSIVMINNKRVATFLTNKTLVIADN